MILNNKVQTPTYRLRKSGEHSTNAINIQLWGFKNCPVVNAGGVAEALSLLPAHLLEGLKNVYFESVPLVPGITGWVRLPGRTNLLGRYDKKTSSILLHACQARRELFQALFHELGHFAYFRIISSVEKKRWVTEIYKREAPVSRYGGRNAAEDFAEAFSLYLIEPEAMQKWPIKNGFIRDVVVRGVKVEHEEMMAIISRNREEDVVPGLDQYV